MSRQVLKDFAVDLIEEFKDAAAGKGSKEASRAAYESLSPQVFAQDEKELKEEFKSLQSTLSGKTKGYNKPSKEVLVKPPITMKWQQIRSIWRAEFAKFKKLEKSLNFNGKKKGSDGEYLTGRGKNNDWIELSNAAKKMVGGGTWYICPVIDYKKANSDLKRKFGVAIAAAEIKNRKDRKIWTKI